MVASSTDDVTLACLATTDARRAEHLRVTWYRDRLPVSSDRLPISSDRLPASSDRLRASSKERGQLPFSSDRLPVSSEERGTLPFSSGRFPVSSEELDGFPVCLDRLPVSSETGRVRIMGDGSRLVIVDARVDDSGVYRCAASNGVDHDSASVRVTIKGLSML